MPKKNGFFYFMINYKKEEEKNGRMFRNLSEVVPLAGAIWEKLDAEQRKPYIQQTKQSQNENAGQLNSLGIPQSVIEERLRAKKNKIEAIETLIAEKVKGAESRHELPKEVFYVISVAYFGRTLQGQYLPAELGVVKYCLEHGVMDRMHKYINLSEIPVGAALSVNTHTKKTHNLPLPPNAFGTESSDEVAQCLLNFLASEKELPPLFTDEETLPIVEGMLRTLLHNHVKYELLHVCPLSVLFFRLKQATERHFMGKSKFPSAQTAQYILKMDCYDYSIGISCDYHETEYNYLHCALSQATRWAYILSKYCCSHMGIECVPGKHIPLPLDPLDCLAPSDEPQPSTSGTNLLVKQAKTDSSCTDAELVTQMDMEKVISKIETQHLSEDDTLAGGVASNTDSNLEVGDFLEEEKSREDTIHPLFRMK